MKGTGLFVSVDEAVLDQCRQGHGIGNSELREAVLLEGPTWLTLHHTLKLHHTDQATRPLLSGALSRRRPFQHFRLK